MCIPTLCIMLKAPVIGKVKTRLAQDIGAEAACAAYRALVEHQIAQVPSHWRVEVHGTPTAELHRLQEWLGPLRTHTLWPQVEGDLGARMAAAVAGAWSRGAHGVVLLGGDCPWLTPAHLQQVEDDLQQVPVTLIPALDGGYVALGLNHPVDELFEGMPWSQSTLVETTRVALRDQGLAWTEQSPLRDVDTLDDWLLAANHVASASAPNSTGRTHVG